MTNPLPPRLPLVITGQPGAGKSAVLARAALQLEASGHAPGLAFHARGAGYTQLLDALGTLAGVPDGAARPAVLDALASPPTGHGSWWTVVVDALDEAGSELRELARTLRDVAGLDTVRVVVASRRREARDPVGGAGVAPGSLLGELVPDEGSVVDLDGDRYFDPDGLTGYVEELLRQPGPPGRAWETYRADAALRRRLAGLIAARAGRNHLVAVMAADPLHESSTTVDPAADGFDPTLVPSTVGDALDRHLDTLPPGRRELRRGLLTALAYARGAGLDDALWQAFARGLGYENVGRTDLDELRASTAADYLLQTDGDGAGGRVVRLFHQALADQLRTGGNEIADETAVVDLLESVVGSVGPQSGGPYAHAHLGDHAAAVGLLPRVLANVDHLLHADLERLRPLLRGPEVRHDDAARVVRLAGTRTADLSPGDRAPVFALAAAQLGADELHRRYGSRSTPARPRWAQPGSATEYEELVGHRTDVRALALGRLSDGRDLLVSGGRDHTVRLWDPATARQLHVLTGHRNEVTDVAFAQLADGRDLVVSAGADRTVRLWDPFSGRELRTLSAHTESVLAVTLGRLADGTDVVASGGWDRTVRLWDPVTGRELHVLHGHSRYVSSVTLCRLADGTDAVMSSGGEIRVWDPVTGRERHQLSGGAINVIRLPLPDGTDAVVVQNESVTSLQDPTTGRRLASMTHYSARSAVAVLGDGRPVLATAGYDRAVHLWDPTGRQRQQLARQVDGFSSVAVGGLADGRDVVVTGDQKGGIKLWEIGDPTLAERITHVGTVFDADTARLADGRHVLATSCSDGLVLVWDTQTGDELRRFTERQAYVSSVTLGRLADGRDVVAAGGHGRTVSLWDVATGDLVGTLEGHDGVVDAIALGRLADGRDVLASAGRDDTVRLWDPVGGSVRHTLVMAPGSPSSVAFGRLADMRVVLAVAGTDLPLTLWDPDSGAKLRSFTGTVHRSEVVTFGTLTNGQVVLATGENENVRLWDPDTGRDQGLLAGPPPGGPDQDGHRDVTALRFGRLSDGRDILASGARDYTVRLWDPVTGRLLRVLAGQSSWPVSFEFGRASDGSDVLTAMTADGSPRQWDPLAAVTFTDRTRHGDMVTSLAVGLDADGREIVASGSRDGTACVWDADTGRERSEPLRHGVSTTTVALGRLADGRPVLISISGISGATAWLLDPVTGDEIRSFDGLGHQELLAVGRLADGRDVLATGVDPLSHDVDRNTIQLVDFTTGQELASLVGESSLRGLAFGQLPDGQDLLAVAGGVGAVQVWDPLSGAQLGSLSGPTSWTTGVCSGRLTDGRQLIAASGEEGRAWIWDAATARLVHVLSGHSGTVTGVSFGRLADGRDLLATAGRDGTVRMWDPVTGTQIALAQLFGEVAAVVVTSRGVVAACGPALCCVELDGTSGS